MEPTIEPLEPITAAPEIDDGYQKVLANRHVQMIAFGGAIGVGLFLGSAQRLQTTGPGLVFAYAVAGLAAFFVMRALCELEFWFAALKVQNPRKVLPRAINGVIGRIAIFYVGSILLLVLVLPWTVYRAGESPFVTVFGALGVPAIGGIMNTVVLTAAMSSCNSGLYSTGRILRALADEGEARAFTGRMSARQIPYGGIFLTALVYLAGVVLNAVVPSDAFDIATSVASLGVLSTWTALLYCQIQLRGRAERGELRRPGFRMPGSPWTNWATLVFLAFIIVEMCFDHTQRLAVLCIPPLALVLWIGWRAIRARDLRS